MNWTRLLVLVWTVTQVGCGGVFRPWGSESWDTADTDTEWMDTACDECIEICDDGIDNDKDNRIDCDDSDCIGAPGCNELCDDGIDNDGDGLVDCEDGDCATSGACVELCDDGIDNDGDGLIDCTDDDCYGPECHTSPVSSWVESGRMSLQGRLQYTYRFGSTCSPVAFGAKHQGSGTAYSVTGKVQATPKGATGPVECDWTVSRASFMQRTTLVTFPTYDASVYVQPVRRTGVSVEPGCGIGPTATWFLPQELRPFRGRVPDNSSQVWYSGARVGGFSTSSSAFNFTCSSFYTWVDSSGSFVLNRADTRSSRYP